MSTTNAVDLGGVHVRGAWNAPGGDVRAELAVYTKTGQARLADLDERALLGLADQCIDALKKLRTHHEITLRAAMQPDVYVSPGEAGRRLQAEAAMLDDSPRAMLDVEVERMACPHTGCVLSYLHAGQHEGAPL